MEIHPYSVILDDELDPASGFNKRTLSAVISELFVDRPHPWRQERYQLTLNAIIEHLKNDGQSEDSLIELIGDQKTELHLLLKQVLQALYSKDDIPFSDRYYTFLKALRAVIKSKQYIKAFTMGYWQPGESVLVGLAHKLCRVLYQDVHIDAFCHDVVKTIETAGMPHTETTDDETQKITLVPPIGDYIDTLSLTHDYIVSAPASYKVPYFHELAQMMRGHLNICYDSHLQENVPYQLYATTLPNEGGSQKPLYALRIGTPTQEKLFGFLFPSATINPEFIGFMNDLRFSKKRHVYFNLQLRRNRFFWQNESFRCSALEKIQDQYSETLMVITLAKNSPFYYQKGRFEKMEDADIFKMLFLQEMRFGKHFYFPKKLTEDPSHNFFEDVKKMLDDVHSIHFDQLDFLSIEERMDFIEIFYVRLQEYCLAYFQADSYNITCRDGIDRAGAANALFYINRLQKEGQTNNPSAVTKIKDILFAPALFVKKRAIRNSRLQRFISAAHRLLKN
ncbi:MAG: hypothetical protein JHC93_07485 [Parachlamydiales bacterium]|nr:hypothetical protein [Parachlamydiales bacterium]